MHVLMIQPGMPPYLADRIREIASRPDIRLTVGVTSSGQLGRPDEPFDDLPIEVVRLADGALEHTSPRKLVGPCRELVRSAKADVVYAGGISPVNLTASLSQARSLGLPTMAYFPSTDYDPRPGGLRGFLAHQVKKRILRRITRILVAGKRAHEHLARFGVRDQHVRIVGNPVRNQTFREAADALRADPAEMERRRVELGLPSRRFFLFVGRLDPDKNLPAMMQAYASARQAAGGDFPPLVFVGGGPQEEMLKAQAESLGVTDAVHFLGYFNTARLTVAYAHALALCLTSIRERWGLVINEALASGVPAVASIRCGCVPDLVIEGETGWIVDPLSVDSIRDGFIAAATADAAIADDDAGREARIARLWQQVAPQSIEAFADGFIESCEWGLSRR